MSAHGDPTPMTSHAAGPLSGEAHVPGDKSISHRSLILGAMTVGETTVTGLLEGQDVLDTAKAMAAFGAEIDRTEDGTWHIHGVGTGGFREPEDVINCGNAGTGVRLIMGAMATTPITATFTGDHSLRSRPMGRITDPLALFGAASYGRRGGRLPLTLVGAGNAVPVNYSTPVASAQIKSAVLLAGLNAPGETVVTEEESTPILEYLFDHQIQPEFTCRFRWRKGSVAFWDNRCTKHIAVDDVHNARRVMRRIQVTGDRPY